MLVARRAQVAHVLRLKVLRPNGQHRIRTCDLYGVNQPSDTHFRAVEMTVFIENISPFEGRQQKQQFPPLSTEKTLSTIQKRGSGDVVAQREPLRLRDRAAGSNDHDRIRHRLAVGRKRTRGANRRGALPWVFSRLLNSPPAPALPA